MSIIIFSLLPNLCDLIIKFTYPYINHPEDFYLDSQTLYLIFLKIIIFICLILFVPFIAIFFISTMSSFIQVGSFNISAEPLIPQLNRISLFAGFKRLFSFKSVFELLKGILKLSVVGLALYFTISPKMQFIEFSHQSSIVNILLLIFQLIKKMFIVTLIILFLLAIADYVFQRFEYYKSLRMTKEEVKEEHKQQEGSPEIKSKLKQIRANRARTRMMSSVPDADVIITNPTHYSIALKYDSAIMEAPKVVAKGQDLIALKIREIAKENNIPLVENKHLAQVLYKNTDIGKEIPIEHYQAVAEVINYVYSLKQKK
jgi:flagellar biosynthesis protein FlhB